MSGLKKVEICFYSPLIHIYLKYNYVTIGNPFTFICFKIKFILVFSLNGELLVDPSAGDAAFSEIGGETFVPAATLGIGQKCRLNFGHEVDSFKYFTMCGLQEGYEPFCV